MNGLPRFCVWLIAGVLCVLAPRVHAVTATITSPSSDVTYTAPASFTVSSQAGVWEDGERLVSHKIYRNGTEIASGDKSLSVAVSGLAAGTYYFYSQATNNLGQAASSATRTVTVIVAAPTVSLNTPTGSPFIAPATIGLSANATDDQGVTKVEFLSGSTVIATDTTAPYEFSWTNVAAGTYSITAKAYDGNALSTTSSPVSVTVNPSTIKGDIDTVVLESGVYRIKGWACSTGMDQSIDVHLYVGGAAGTGTFIGGYTANLASEPVVAAACYASGPAYRFSIPLSDAARTAHANKKIYIHGISPVGQPNLLLSGSGILSVPPPLAAKRRYIYDAHQQLCKSIEPETGITVMSYDVAGNVEWTASAQNTLNQTDCSDIGNVPPSARVTRTYDARNRLRTLAFPDGLGNQAWAYTADGLPATITTDNSAGGTQVINAYTYNKRRLLAGETVQQPGWYTWSLGYGYNANGHLARIQHPGNELIDYAPNQLGHPTQVTSAYGTYATAVTYHPNGAIKQFTYGNGVVHTLTQNVRGLPDVSSDAYGATQFLADGYDYDANGNVVAITDGATGTSQRGNRTMSYDDLDRLKTTVSPMYSAAPSSTTSYAYDGLDNLIRVVAPGRDHYYCYDSSWRLTNIKTGSCSGASVVGLGYDSQGNVEAKNGVAFDFDHGNRLRSAAGESYRYDGHGRRVVADLSGSGPIVSQYGHDGVLRFQSDNRQQKVFNHIYLGSSLVAIRETASGTTNHTIKYQHTDALGSPVVVTDASRNVLERNEYEPFGKVLKPTAPKNGPGYTGHVFDAATGMNYMQQRYYDPGIGRFLSVDPVTADGNTGGNFNRYWYANNNPYLFTDPDGRQSFPRMGTVNPNTVVTTSRTQSATDQATKFASGKLVDAAPKSVLGEVGGSAAGGSPVLSGAVQGSGGVLVPLTGAPSAEYVTGGAMVNLGGASASAPGADVGRQGAIGASYDAGPAIGLTNATSGSQLEGTSTAYSLNTPAFTATVTTSESGVWTAVVGTPAVGLSVSKQAVETKEVLKDL